ncbi:hypothetical protein G3480_06700 [Thiorhodococcus mannitoliphagus]|uniref:Uncharacterized protein n=1 Tax=Thiorhodococcus mannitoliphagus TaxID=329406 RepID=A0A6P1DWI0_9GAMM|nr:hypothetical protein [Thiorhodococcus mannitoliphagus]
MSHVDGNEEGVAGSPDCFASGLCGYFTKKIAKGTPNRPKVLGLAQAHHEEA